MTQITDPRWGEYARIQRMLKDRRIVDDSSLGLEAALNSLVSTAVSPRPGETTTSFAQRTYQSAMRRQRRQRGLLAREERLLLDVSRAEADRPGDAAAHARIELTRIFGVVTVAERSVITSLVEGGEVASASGLAPAAFRKRLQRLRVRLAA